MNRKNLLTTLALFALIALALFAFTPWATDCVAEERNGEITESPTNPDSCYFSGKRSGKWEERFASGTVQTGNYVDGKRQGKWELRFADGRVDTGNMVDGKKHGKWEERFADGRVEIHNFINGEMTYKTNFLHGSTNDAEERVKLFDDLGLYEKEHQLINATIYSKQVDPFIYAHDLHDVIVKYNGFLQDSGLDNNSKNDSLKELILLIDAGLKSEADKTQVIDKLILGGIKRDTAEAVVRELCKPNPYFEVLTFIVLGSSVSVGLFYILHEIIGVIGVNRINALTLGIFGLFIGSFLSLSFILSFSGKTIAIFRVALSTSTVLFSILLTLTLFMHDDWGEAYRFSSGGGIASTLFKFIVASCYFIGSTGCALIMTAVSFLVSFISWAEWHKFAKGDYSKIE